MRLLKVVLFLLTLSVTYGENCMDISGAWRDDLGSNMTLQVEKGSNRITGKFVSEVDSTEGAQTNASRVAGIVVPVKGGSLVAFSVIFINGSNLASWAGQCMVCDGQEVLQTTFLLRFAEPPGANWLSTTINRNLFFRPPDAAQVIQQLENMVPDVGLNVKTEGLVGTWTSVLGTDDKIDIQSGNDIGSWEGEHRPPGRKNSRIIGILDGDQKTHAALGFASSTGKQSRAKVQVWAGHIRNLMQDEQPLLETSFLEHKFSDRCGDPLRYVRYSMDNYTMAATA